MEIFVLIHHKLKLVRFGQLKCSLALFKKISIIISLPHPFLFYLYDRVGCLIKRVNGGVNLDQPLILIVNKIFIFVAN